MIERTGTAYWNKDSGAVWIEFDDGCPSRRIADCVGDALSAYAAVASDGWIRHGDWLIVVGNPRQRSLAVTTAQLTP